MKTQPVLFEDHQIRRIYNEATETWWLSVVDIIQILAQQPDYQAARNYWKVLKNRLGKKGSESVTKCNRLKPSSSPVNNSSLPIANYRQLIIPKMHGDESKRNTALI